MCPKFCRACLKGLLKASNSASKFDGQGEPLIHTQEFPAVEVDSRFYVLNLNQKVVRSYRAFKSNRFKVSLTEERVNKVSLNKVPLLVFENGCWPSSI